MKTAKEQVSLERLKEQICIDNGISYLKYSYKSNLSNTKGIKKFVRGCASSVAIITEEGEFPFLTKKVSRNGKEYVGRNEEMMSKAMKLRKVIYKNFSDIERELGIKIASKKCRVCEGGGCYSGGWRYSYRDIYCEV